MFERCLVPFLLGKIGQDLPLAQRMQTPHLTHRDSEGIWVNSFASLVRGKGLFPSLELFEPSLLELHVTIGLGFTKDTNGSIRLLQLVVDGNKGLHSSRILVLLKFKLLVMESLSECMALRSILAQRTDINRQRLIIVLHEFSKIKEYLKNFRRDVGRSKRLFNGPNQLFLVLIIQLCPTRYKGSVKQVPSERLVYTCQTGTCT